jgi:hypothetical protein
MRSPVTSGEAGGPVSDSPPSPTRAAGHLRPEDVYVYLPYVVGMLRSETTEALGHGPCPVVPVRLPADHPYAYTECLARWWDRGEVFIICEQDIVPPIWSIERLVRCPRPWCYHPYDVGGGPTGPMLGLVKFDPATLSTNPRSVPKALRPRSTPPGWVHWRSSNEAIQRALVGMGARPHQHLPAAVHLHDYGAGNHLPGVDRAHKVGPAAGGDRSMNRR